MLVGGLNLGEVDDRVGWDIDGLYVSLKPNEKQWVRGVVEGARTLDGEGAEKGG